MNATTDLRICVLGLGSMGLGMAASLRKRGFAVTGYDPNAEALKRFAEAGGQGAASPAEAARGADVVLSVVVNAAQTETALFGLRLGYTAVPCILTLIGSFFLFRTVLPMGQDTADMPDETRPEPAAAV